MARILLAEDDKSMLNFLMIALQRAGHKVIARSNGTDALHALEEESDTPFDLLLTDIVMPGIDGLELAHKTTEKHPNIKVMFITGFAAMALEDHKKRNQGKGARRMPQILSKPFHLNDLVMRIEALLES
jgi:two-component system cell cycle response regulator CpdR